MGRRRQPYLMKQDTGGDGGILCPALQVPSSLPLPPSNNCETHFRQSRAIEAGAGSICPTDTANARSHAGSERFSIKQPRKKSTPDNSSFWHPSGVGMRRCTRTDSVDAGTCIGARFAPTYADQARFRKRIKAEKTFSRFHQGCHLGARLNVKRREKCHAYH